MDSGSNSGLGQTKIFKHAGHLVRMTFGGTSRGPRPRPSAGGGHRTREIRHRGRAAGCSSLLTPLGPPAGGSTAITSVGTNVAGPADPGVATAVAPPRPCALRRELAEQLVDLLPISQRCRGCSRRRAGTDLRRLARDRTYRYRAVRGRRRLSTGRENHQQKNAICRALGLAPDDLAIWGAYRRSAGNSAVFDATSWRPPARHPACRRRAFGAGPGGSLRDRRSQA